MEEDNLPIHFWKRLRESRNSVKVTVPSELAEYVGMEAQEDWTFVIDDVKFNGHLVLAGSKETRSLEFVIPKKDAFEKMDTDTGDIAKIITLGRKKEEN